MIHSAQIITSYGRRYIVRTEDGLIYEANTRSKRTDFTCGDWVEIDILNNEQAVIETLLPRQSLLYRQDAYKTKLIAANVSQLIIVVAAQPTPSEALLQRALIAAEAAHINAIIVINKSDLPETDALKNKLHFYQQLGYPIYTISARNHSGSLKEILEGHTNILLGQSGMGKSTITNVLLGEQRARTNDISTALDSGKHTTTHTQLYDLNQQTQLIDSPGLQEFGLHHLDINNLIQYFPDMRHLIGQCRFHNCTHRAEPDCVLKQAVQSGEIRQERLALLQKITNELES